MKNKRIVLMIPAFLFLISLSSCKKYLDKKSDDTLVIPQTLNDFQGLLDDIDIMNTNTPSMGESSSDDYFITKSTFDTRPSFSQDVYTWTPADYYFQNDWSFNYNPVYNANLCLEGLDKIQKTKANEAQWNNIEGSAFFFRAYSFLNLSWIYAKAYDPQTYNSDLGIALRLSSDFNIPSVRASVKESYGQVISDAKQAILYLPDNSQNVMRPSKAAAYGLLSRAYLSMREYDSAGKYADKALQLKADLLDYNNTAEVNVNASVPFKPYNTEIVFYSEMNTSTYVHSTTKSSIDTVLYSYYSDGDLRKTVFFSPSGGYQKYKGSYLAISNHFFTGIATDELYLIRAECSARVGNQDAALNDLNFLLMNRYKTGTFVPETASSAKEALTIILKERRKELTMRGLRWIDIKRLNKEDAGIVLKRIVGDKVYTLPPNDDRYALPLPADIILNTGMKQN
jgi:starch-binding outer membrane protein, SusD/RagB family